MGVQGIHGTTGLTHFGASVNPAVGLHLTTSTIILAPTGNQLRLASAKIATVLKVLVCHMSEGFITLDIAR